MEVFTAYPPAPKSAIIVGELIPYQCLYIKNKSIPPPTIYNKNKYLVGRAVILYNMGGKGRGGHRGYASSVYTLIHRSGK